MRKNLLLISIFSLLLTGCENDAIEPSVYTITLADDGNGTAKAIVEGEETTEAAEGATVMLTAVPNEGYEFDKWTSQSNGVAFENAAASLTTFIMPAGNVEIRAEFRIAGERYSITLTDDGNGTAEATVEGRKVIEAAAGATVTLTAIHNEGYVFDKWSTESSDVTFKNAGAASTTFTMPANSVEIRAEFIEDNIDVLSMITDPLFKGLCEYAMTNEYQYWNYIYSIDPFIHHAWDTNSDGILSLSEAYAVKAIYMVGQLIRSFEGIEYFKNLEVFGCGSTTLASLDLSHNTALTMLLCSNSNLSSLDVSKNTALIYLDCNRNLFTSLDVSKNTELQTLNCSQNELSSLDMSKNTKLVSLTCSSNDQQTSLDVSECTALEYLDCSFNRLTSLNVSNNTALAGLACVNNQITSLNISNNTALMDLACYNNRMSALDITNMTTYPSGPFLYVVCCGNQTTDGTTPLTLTLTMREDQKPYWDSFLNNSSGYGAYNTNVVLAN